MLFLFSHLPYIKCCLNVLFADLNLQYILDAKKENTKRLFFHKQEGTSHLNKSVTIKKEKVWTEKFFVYLPATGILDKLTSIDIQVCLKCILFHDFCVVFISDYVFLGQMLFEYSRHCQFQCRSPRSTLFNTSFGARRSVCK